MNNQLKINSESKIFVACPANLATGGPELLHQLVYELNNLKIDAFMYYFNASDRYPVHNAYEKYKNPYVNNISDNVNNILIVPETKTFLLKDFKKVQKVIWWLSVDNYYGKFLSTNPLKKLVKRLLYYIGKYDYHFERDKSLFHFVQSEYARNYLKSKNIKNIMYLSDYLNLYFIEGQQQKSVNFEKKNIVIYNPKKGFKFTQEIINQAKNITFIPIKDMTKEEVSKLLLSAKLYIDFGNHPGKDRIPREASISGCCLITSKRGSAGFYDDVPIPDRFKFEDKKKCIPAIIEMIENILADYQKYRGYFDLHRDMIIKEHDVFIEDIKKIFVKTIN